MGWWERSSPNPLASDRAATIRCVTLVRPPRTPVGAVGDRVRRSILLSADRLGIPAATLVALHADAEHIGSWPDLIADVEERYRLPSGSISDRVTAGLRDIIVATGAKRSTRLPRAFYEEHTPACILMTLPDTEFLTVLEHSTRRWEVVSATMAYELFEAADAALRAHGAPYRRAADSFRFEWTGDPAQHELTVQPGLLALADPRLVGARSEFEEAVRKRRLGTPKDLKDAIDEAAKAVESTLKVLHDEHRVRRPRNEQISSLFDTLV